MCVKPAQVVNQGLLDARRISIRDHPKVFFRRLDRAAPAAHLGERLSLGLAQRILQKSGGAEGQVGLEREVGQHHQWIGLALFEARVAQQVSKARNAHGVHLGCGLGQRINVHAAGLCLLIDVVLDAVQVESLALHVASTIGMPVVVGELTHTGQMVVRVVDLLRVVGQQRLVSEQNQVEHGRMAEDRQGIARRARAE